MAVHQRGAGKVAVRQGEAAELNNRIRRLPYRPQLKPVGADLRTAVKKASLYFKTEALLFFALETGPWASL